MKQRKSSFHGVVAAVEAERARQAAKWGSEHDSQHTLQDWLDIAGHEHFEANVEIDAHDEKMCRQEILHIATVAFVALEWYGVPEEVER